MMAKSKRKFYKTIFYVEVLSEDTPLEDVDSLHDIAYAIDEGDCSGMVNNVKSVRLTAQKAAQALIEQGSDPEFFQLDKNGNELEI